MQVERRRWRTEQKEWLDEQLPKATGRSALISLCTLTCSSGVAQAMCCTSPRPICRTWFVLSVQQRCVAISHSVHAISALVLHMVHVVSGLIHPVSCLVNLCREAQLEKKAARREATKEREQSPDISKLPGGGDIMGGDDSFAAAKARSGLLPDTSVRKRQYAASAPGTSLLFRMSADCSEGHKGEFPVLLLACCVSASVFLLDHWYRVLSFLLNSHVTPFPHTFCESAINPALIRQRSCWANPYDGLYSCAPCVAWKLFDVKCSHAMPWCCFCCVQPPPPRPPPPPPPQSPTETCPHLHSPQCILLVQGGKEG